MEHRVDVSHAIRPNPLAHNTHTHTHLLQTTKTHKNPNVLSTSCSALLLFADGSNQKGIFQGHSKGIFKALTT
eukprot:326320-Rhodomonas_salina.2